jgi:Rhodopirellula transposase DDE domain
MDRDATLEGVRRKFELLRPLMNERMRRHWAACEALTLPRGGVTMVAQATGLSRTTIWAGLRELRCADHHADDGLPFERSRHAGAGRPFLEEVDPTLVSDLEALLDATTRGDPQSPLRWTCKSTRNLAEELNRQGHRVGYRTVAAILHDLDYSLQANRKTREGASHPDRDAQFEYINRQVRSFQRAGQPAVSVDSKKREWVGEFKNAGREWRPAGHPEEVRAKDFPDKRLGKVTPWGVYDLTYNEGWVSVGIDHNTAQFATETLRRWWCEMGAPVYPNADRLLVTADAGGSNGYRCRLWKVALQQLADTLGLRIAVCHFPPGTSKWNKIEHRMFCQITKNWRGKPLRSRAVVVNLIGNTKTKTGLHIEAELDTNSYESGIKVSDKELAAVQIEKAAFHGEWNYTISPKPVMV